MLYHSDISAIYVLKFIGHWYSSVVVVSLGLSPEWWQVLCSLSVQVVLCRKT